MSKLTENNLVGDAQRLFPKIDDATQHVIALLGEYAYHEIDLQLIMLGLPNRAFVPGNMQKRINRVEPIKAEVETEKAIAANKGGKAETQTERGIRLTNGECLRIIDNGIISFIKDGKPYRFTTDFKAIGESALNETALYRALAATAEEILNKTKDADTTKWKPVRQLRDYVDELTDIIKASFSGLPEGKRFELDQSLEIRERIYKDLFDKKRIKPTPDLPAGAREDIAALEIDAGIER